MQDLNSLPVLVLLKHTSFRILFILFLRDYISNEFYKAKFTKLFENTIFLLFRTAARNLLSLPQQICQRIYQIIPLLLLLKTCFVQAEFHD